LPEHIAIIMDGNGRWAKNNNLIRTKGHLKGLQAARQVVLTAANLNIKYLTLFAFSSENWKRPKFEVSFLINLIKEKLSKELSELYDNNVKINFIGDLTSFGSLIEEKLLYWQEKSKNNTGLYLSIALNYGGKWDIVESCKKIATLVKNNELNIEDINPNIFSNNLSTKNIPDPDLLIRTSGEYRVSNFLLWQLSYSELFFTNTLWPDFSKEELLDIIEDYATRERRFGLTNEQAS